MTVAKQYPNSKGTRYFPCKCKEYNCEGTQKPHFDFWNILMTK